MCNNYQRYSNRTFSLPKGVKVENISRSKESFSDNYGGRQYSAITINVNFPKLLSTYPGLVNLVTTPAFAAYEISAPGIIEDSNRLVWAEPLATYTYQPS